MIPEEETLELGIDPERIAREELAKIVASGVPLTRGQAQAIAELSGRSVRTIYNWAAAEKTGAEAGQGHGQEDRRNLLERLAADGAEAFVFDDLATAMVYAVGGNLRRFRDELQAAGLDVPSYPTVARRWAALPPLVRDGARHGVANRFNKCLHLLHSAGSPNECWQLDDFSLDIEVLRPGARRATCRPHLLLAVDDFDRVPVCWAVLPGDPTSADVLACLAAGFEARPAADGSPAWLGGMPQLILWDNASVNTGNVIIEALARLPMMGRAVAPYTPVAKGKVERAGQTIQAAIVTGLAGVRTTAQTIAKKDLFAARVSDLLSFEDLVAHVEAVIYEYTYRRRHTSLGATPIAARAGAGFLPVIVPDEDLAWMWLPKGPGKSTGKVQQVGVNAFGGYWIAPELDMLVGKDVELRMLHHRRERLAVFYQDKFVCFAVPNMNVDDPLRDEILDARSLQRHRVYKAARNARAMQAETATQVTAGEGFDLVDAANVVAATPHPSSVATPSASTTGAAPAPAGSSSTSRSASSSRSSSGSSSSSPSSSSSSSSSTPSSSSSSSSSWSPAPPSSSPATPTTPNGSSTAGKSKASAGEASSTGTRSGRPARASKKKASARTDEPVLDRQVRLTTAPTRRKRREVVDVPQPPADERLSALDIAMRSLQAATEPNPSKRSA